MTRLTISVGPGTGNNIGSPLLLTLSGRITAVLFQLFIGGLAPGFNGAQVQLCQSPVYTTSIGTTGLNPPEVAQIGLSTYLDTTATQSYVVQQEGGSVLVPSDFPVTQGEQLFVNSVVLAAGNIAGFIVIHLV